jgi:FlaA1/EpsC-like NDP-sugar epimerase
MRTPWRLGRFPIRPLHVLIDALLIAICVFASVLLRVGPEEFWDFFPVIVRYLPIIVTVRLASLIVFSCYSIIWRYVTASDAFRIAQSVMASTALIVFVSFFTTQYWHRLPRSTYFIDAALVASALLGIRLLRRLQMERRNRRSTRAGLRTLIYGAGVNGKTLASRFQADAGLNTHVLGFIDDAQEKIGMTVSNLRVLGSRADLADLLREFSVQHLVIAIPNLPAETLREVITVCTSHGIRPLVTSSFGSQEMVSWRDHQIVRPVSLRDLLNRPTREMDLEPVKNLVRGKRVLVTGAGGSIGAEISRQVAGHSPSRLVLVDHSEFGLFEIDKELRSGTQGTDRVCPVLLDIKDQEQLDRLINREKPEIVIHAAAYKHVHLAEENFSETIRNNVLGTRNLLTACTRQGVSVFLLISTDKAVNPKGVMGATKRVAELLTTLAALQTGQRYCSVRFGNVLGSSGSLIPILESQIQQGGPVTITHPDMTRYFMLIPEAVSLVLKACTIAKPGDINVLKMGEPVRIVDIAKNMIALSGRPEAEIPIVFTGIRPGEKLSEELYLRGDEIQTEHPDILTLPTANFDIARDSRLASQVNESITTLVQLAEKDSAQCRKLLFELCASTPAPALQNRLEPIG